MDLVDIKNKYVWLLQNTYFFMIEGKLMHQTLIFSKIYDFIYIYLSKFKCLLHQSSPIIKNKYFEATTKIYFSICTRSRLKYFLIYPIYSALYF